MACFTGDLRITTKDPRINYNLRAGETLMTCPYVKSHAVLPIKFHRHVNNCHRLHCKEQQQKGLPVLFSICQHDRSHHVPHAELAYHEANCTARVDAADDWGCDYVSAGGSSGGGGDGAAPQFKVTLKEPTEPTQADLNALLTEDWDAVPDDGLRFNPERRIHDLRVAGYSYIRTQDPIGLTKSEKKEFYAKEEESIKRYTKQAMFNRLQKEKESQQSATIASTTASTTGSEQGESSASIYSIPE